MTVYSGNDSPKKPVVAHGHRLADTRRRLFNKKNVILWLLIASLPFLVLRLVFFFSPPENEADLRTGLEFPSPDVSLSGHTQTASSPDSSSAPNAANSSPSPLPNKKSENPIVARPPTEEVRVDPEGVKHVHMAPAPLRLGEEELSPEDKSEGDENLRSPEDNEKEAEKWQAPSPAEKNVDEQGIDQLAETNASALAPAAPQECDFYVGDWVHDPEGPLYTNATCFYMQGHQNCMGNGRPDTAYLYWKWKPQDCDLPRFNGQAFLEEFWGKTIGFVGDSLSRNQMQSLLCMLSQVEIPVMIYQNDEDKNVRWLFKNHQVTLATIWSPYLLRETDAEYKGIKKGQSKLFTDTLDEEWTSVMNDFDVMVLSIGQWFFKSSIYIENDEVIGCHYCPGHNITEMGFFQAYQKAVSRVLNKVTNDYKGFTVMSTFALDHYEHGTWDNNGSCTREQPLTKGQLGLGGTNTEMHQIVMHEYESMVQRRKRNNKKVQLGLLDVTLLSLLRVDGHPGPFRVAHPFDGVPPGTHVTNDCLHWCLPGPADTWNQLLVEIVSSHLKKS